MLEKLGYRADMATWAAPADATIGRVVCVDRGVATVLTERGPVRACAGADVLADMAHDATAAPCTGDWVVVRDWPDHRLTIHTVLPRTSAVVRATAGGQSHGQVLCANADLVGLVVALHPLPVLARVERLVALAWDSGAQPLVVLTKADLVTDAASVADDVAAAAPGVEVVRVSAVTGEGLTRLHELIDGRSTLALVGTSGHGKSSLTNALVGAEVLGTRAIREDGRGRHTSVRRELVALPGGGAVIDTPGLRGLGLLASERGLARAFADVETVAARCRFADCSHQREPGCAVVEAVTTGDVSARRLESWRKLRGESATAAARRELRLRGGSRRGRQAAVPDDPDGP